MKKKYNLSVIEEFWPYQRPGTHIGRIEVYDDTHPYAIYEARFGFEGEDELYRKFREMFDDIEVSNLPLIIFNHISKEKK